MKILLLYYSPWWNATAYYGVTLAQGLQKAGCTVWFGTDDKVPAGREARKRNIRVFKVKLQTLNPFRLAYEIWRTARFMRHEQIDIVNTFSPQGHLFHFLTTRIFGTKAHLVRTCCDVRKPKGNRFNRYLYNRWVSWLVFPCKSNFERYYEVLRFPPRKTSIIYGAIDINSFDHNKPAQDFREEYAVDKQAPVVGIVARLSPEKGHRHFLHVAAKVASKIRNIQFVIVGRQEEVSINSLKELAAHLGISDRVIFTGFLDDPRAAVDDFSVGVIASRFSETVSRAALEYMASSKPVIATNVNVLAEIIRPGKTGMVFEIDDVNGMANGIVELLNGADKCRQWGENARNEIMEKYTIDKLASNTLKVYEDIVNGNPSRG